MNERKRDNLIILIILIVTVAFLIAVIIYAERVERGIIVSKQNKVLSIVFTDCIPDSASNRSLNTKAICIERGCLWQTTNVIGVPNCQYPNQTGGYKLKEKISPYQFLLDKKNGPDLYHHHSKEIVVNFTIYNNYALRVLFYDPNVARFQVPKEAIDVQMRSNAGLDNAGYTVEFCDDPWGFRVIRKSTQTILFNTCDLTDLTFSNQFLQITARIASENVYGFGEHTAHSFKRDMNYKRWSMWTRDEIVSNNSWNLYGHQPFYLNLEEDGNANGVLLLNSNAMDIFLQPSPAITFRTTGGVLDFYFFIGPEPDTVIQQYVSTIGRPILPPYWALGFHLCRWGYTGTEEINSLLDLMTQYDIPQDGQWIDIDSMYEKHDFTYDHSKSWINLPKLIERIHQDHKKYIAILDAGVAAVDKYQLNFDSNPINVTYQPLIDGVAYDVFVKNANGNDYFVGKIWQNTNTYFPDFTHPNATLWMVDQLKVLSQNLTIDGLWIDLNEASNPNYTSEEGQCSRNELNWPPYIPPVKDALSAGLFGKTLCMDAKQNWGSVYDVHSMYGHSMSMVAYDSLKTVSPSKRPFVLTRSNFVGTGHYAFHWLGDDQSLWEQMRWSIVGMLEYNLFGMPFVGADICGFALNTTESLCRRWSHLGAFYPFSRNHNIKGAIPQDPTAFGPDFANATRNILIERYRLLPYLYTLLYYSHVNGSAVVKPLFFDFPRDNLTWNIDTQFMWGSGLMFSPVLQKSATSVKVYYPDWRLYNYYSHEEIDSKGEFVTVPCDESCIIINTIGGTIIPMQSPNTTTYASRRNPIQLLASLDHNYQANGTLFLDDGESESIKQNSFLLVKFRIISKLSNKNNNETTLMTEVKYRNFTTKLQLSEITVLGCHSEPNSVSVNNTNWTFFKYVSSNKSLLLFNLEIDIDKLNDNFKISWGA